MTDKRSIQVLVDDAIYTESPRWHGDALWYSDIGAGQVCRIGATGKEVVLNIDTASGLGWTRGGEILVSSIRTSTIFRAGPDRIPHAFCGPESHGVRGTNDMATVGTRSYVTCSGRDHHPGDDVSLLAQPIGKIIMIDHDTATCSIVASELRMPNGIAVSADGRTLVVAEIFAQRILHFDIGADGSLSKPRVFLDVDHGMDGLALDAAGAIWVGAGNADKFHRIDRNGKYTDSVEVPGWTCIAPMLGGTDGRTLFMAVSKDGGADAIFEGRAKARIVATRVEVPAAPEPLSDLAS